MQDLLELIAMRLTDPDWEPIKSVVTIHEENGEIHFDPDTLYSKFGAVENCTRP